ncbi:hypothetical protein BY458DRAFT_516830 [Sporodiniella umbellata]|nr:hypothetical protein BY458DRAFT_516830 [Sporodiniella umbellata]
MSWSTVIVALSTLVLIALGDFVYRKATRIPFKPGGKACLITGGSTGLGKALAIELAKTGADVCIVARRMEELKEATEEIKANCINENQQIVYSSADVTSHEQVERMFNEAKTKLGRDPEFVCACAGASYPKLFLEHTLKDFEHLTSLNYLGQAYVAHEAAQRMKNSKTKNGKIVFVSSMMGLLGFAGYSTYSPTKFAIRGLADTLRNELKRYGIGVHIFFPGGILSPGFEIENLTKPKVTQIIEGADTPQTCTECAQSLMKGLFTGKYMITTDIIADTLRCVARGVSPTDNLVLDWLMAVIGQPIASGYVLYMDYLVKTTPDTA